MSWRRRNGSRNAAIGTAALLGIVLLALPLVPSLRRYVRMKRM